METPPKTPSRPTEVVAGVEVKLRTAPQGGFLRSGNPGNKGGGRPPDEFKRLMRELASREDSVALLEAIMTGQQGDIDQYLKAREHVVSHGYGKPAQAVEHSGTVGLQIQFVRERSEATSSDTEPQP